LTATPAVATGSSRKQPASADEDVWPHTTRIMPWLIAAFLAMLWLLPFDAIELRAQLPFDSKLDRVVLGVMLIVWVATMLAGGRHAPRVPSNTVVRAVIIFACIAVASVLLNLGRIEMLDERDVAVKKIALLLSYILFFLIVASSVKASELRNFTFLMLALAAITALGTIYEYRTYTNVFYDWAAAVLPDFFKVGPDRGNPAFERANVTGPTGHGLAIATMLAIALPFALAAGMQARDRRERIFYYTVGAIVFAGGIATVRKTAAVVPVAALATLVALRPRQMLRLLPLGFVILVFCQAAAPGAAGTIRSQLQSLDERQSTKGRTADYEAIKPDMKQHPVLGRGFGTYIHDKYRLLDNQFLAILISAGLLGFGAYVAMILAVVVVALGPIRSRDPSRAPPALGAAAAAMAFLVTNGLFDVLAFPQAPYLFFFVAAVAVIAASPQTAAAPARAPLARLDPGIARA
jgi:O-antigen ligase